jgi:dynein heavy chain
MMYPFSLGDLRDSAVCLTNYMESSGGGSKIPWEDLRYIFGQIVYGGHIVNDFDRLLCVTYLKYFMRDELLDEDMELFPFSEADRKATFKTITPTSHKNYLEYIDQAVQGDTPLALGLHPNAEIGFRTTQSENMFNVLAELQPRESSEEEGSSPQHVAEMALNDIEDRFQEKGFDIEEIAETLEERGPFQNVFLQECDAVNGLLREMKRSLNELNLGFAGELTMSDAMEALQDALFMERVPTSWAKLAWPSLRSLGAWLHDLSARIGQLEMWVDNPMEIPKVTWISGLVNPQSFLTAIKQMTAQRTGAALDDLIIQTDVTKRNIDDCDTPSRDGAYICGLSLQGARWDLGSCIVDKSRPKEMFCPLPVINCKSVSASKQADSGIYNCPCYKTEQRGPTFVFCAQLKTKSPADRWIMSGVALIMDIVE